MSYAKEFKKCKIPECNGRVFARAVCQKHYARWIRNGAPEKTYWGKGHITSHGYRSFGGDKNRQYEHRKVMQEIVGRSLRRSEHVHHIDGNKLNNAPSNLELITASEHIRRHKTTTFRNATHKECTRCHAIKPRSAFYPEKQLPGKYRDPNFCWCILCVSLNRKS